MDTATVEQAVRSQGRIGGLTHALYRYPARFPPGFAQAAIAEFTRPDDWVLDPFVGGGTTVVEALAAGRRVAAVDLNSLALLLTRAKTTPLYRSDELALMTWLESDEPVADVSDQRLVNTPRAYVEALAPLVSAARALPKPRQRDIARALLVHVGQWALDGRQTPVAADRMRLELRLVLKQHLTALTSLSERAQSHGLRPSDLLRRRILRQGSASEVTGGRPWNRLTRRFRLVLTSPPYPSVHVLYHRWQVRGRSETPLPYWLSDLNDGLGASHYTLGGRSAKGESTYFDSIARTFRALGRLLTTDARLVQLVSFHEPDGQLPRYLAAMGDAGYDTADQFAVSLREIPNRRWYYRVNPDRGRAHEYLLIHRPRR